MRTTAARLHDHDRPLMVEEVEVADPGDGEVVVDMAYGGVNPVDRYTAEGRVAPDAPRPRTIGSEGSGTCEGRPVLVRGRVSGREGVWAGAVVAREASLIPVPDGVSLEQAATMGIAGVTAWRCAMEKARLTASDRVLVLGATGGVGSMLVSIARSVGAEVWGQTGSHDKAEWVRERGAGRVIIGDAEAVTATANELRPTVVFDPLGGGFSGAAITVMADKGRLVSFGTSAGTHGDVPLQALYRKGLTVFGYGGLIETDQALADGIREALDAVCDGRMEVAIDQAIPLAEVETAFQLLIDRAVRGNLVLDLRDY